MADCVQSETVQQQLVRKLSAKCMTLAAAESCTGGLIGAMLTEVPGASSCFLGGCIVYANETKTALLGVGKDTLEEFGAVSCQCAIEMADSVRAKTNADIAIAVTGIAGPGGGTDAKPVGTVYIGIATAGEHTKARHFVFPGDRVRVRHLTAVTALQWVLGWTQDSHIPVMDHEISQRAQ